MHGPSTDALELPHSANCLVCGRSNPHGLKLRLHVATDSGMVFTQVTPGPHHVGFEGLVHGGLLATVLDEAMTWAATWKNKRFCYCGELTTRFRSSLRPGQMLRVEALVEFSRPKLVEVAGKIFDHTGRLAATSSGKYVPTSLDEHLAYMDTFLEHPASDEASRLLRGLPPAPKVEVQVMPQGAPARAENAGTEAEPPPSADDEPQRASSRSDES
jgi:acyl-coenzyme A thioesterase PaaI-like protein